MMNPYRISTKTKKQNRNPVHYCLLADKYIYPPKAYGSPVDL
uniref:Uncharacterized protein n=1 Tax=viral metagenome TaxID=1070528 RepID=A0A6C0D4T7_9ZZZZ